MKSYRTLSRVLPITARRTLRIKPQSTRKMSLFSPAFVTSDPSVSFGPLFRLLDDFDEYSKGGRHHRQTRTINPRFDVREIGDAYELHGELPGVAQKDVDIEFTDSQTLVIRGRSERSYSTGTRPVGHIEGDKTIEEGQNSHKATGEGENSHKATVEDEGEAKPETSVQASPKHQHLERHDHQSKFWLSERSVGEFSRSFNFPSPVDHDNVKAQMKDGILTITVPKAKKQESRKITIS